MKNLAFVFLIVGAALFVFGFQEYQVADGAELTATNISLSKLEKTGYLSKKNIIISEHLSAYPFLIYKFKGLVGQQEAESFNKIMYIYYPVLSMSNPYAKELIALREKYGEFEKIPENLWPELTSFSMLVKSDKYKNVTDFPNTFRIEKNVGGIVTNDYKNLSIDEQKLIKESFPSLNIGKVKLLDQGRLPIPNDHILVLIGSGIAFLGISIIIFLSLIYKFIKRLIS